MGTMALLRRQADGVTYAECHVNYWCLAGLFGRRSHVFDLGLAFTASNDKTPPRLSVLLPFGVDAIASDLYGVLTTDADAATLIFGTPTDVSRQELRIHEPAGDKVLTPYPVRVSPTPDLASDPALAAEGLSVWDIDLDEALPRETTGYVRVRFRVLDPRRVWMWGRAKRSALVDLRFAEVRETVVPGNQPAIERLSRQFVPVGKLNMLVVAPSWLQFRAATPDLRYIRLFEGKVWEPYLGRAVDLGRSDQLMIYHWRHTDRALADASAEPNDSVRARPGQVNPFRGFLLLTKESRLVPLPNHLLTAILSGALILAAVNSAAIADFGRSVTVTALQILGACIGAVGLTWILGHIPAAHKRISHMPTRVRKIEDGIFRVRANLVR